jgi:anaerobic selenocysteine-containing dehydrogenase
MGEHRFTCNLCDAMCGLRVTTTGPRVTEIRGDPDDVLSHGHICPKANALAELLDDPDRLRSPVRRTASGWEPIGWDEALGLVAAKLSEIRRRHGRDAVALYVGNPTVHSHRAGLGSQLLTAALGTKNRFDANSQDANPRLFACMQVYGDVLSLPVPDVDRTEHLLLLGANPAASNGSMMALGDVRKRMQAIRARGGKVVLVDPRRTETVAWCTSHHFIRPGGDAALLLAMLDVLFSEDLVDGPRVRRIASALGELRDLARGFLAERVAPAIGMSAETIRTLARDLAAAKSACVYGRIGTCQNEFGPLASWLIEALNVVTGNFDREGGAMFPTPAVDVGPIGRLVIGNHWGRWRSRVRGLPEFLGALPSAVLSEEIETPGEGQIRALVCFAGNPVLSTPNGERLDRALGTLEYMVAIDFYLNETTRHADIVLPPRHVFETGNFDLILGRFTVRNVAKYSAPILHTKDDTRDDWDILSDLALRIAGPDVGALRRAWRRIARSLPERIVDLLLRTGPHGLKLSELTSGGVDLGPLVPSARDHIRTADGRVCLVPHVFSLDVPRLDRWVDDHAVATRAHELVLIGRRHLRSNNSWMHNVRSLVKGPDRAQLLMHPTDAERLGLATGASVRVRSRVGAVTTIVAVTDDVMPGVVSLPHGYGHRAAASTMRVAGELPGPSANVLTDELFVEPIVGTSVLNGVPVTVERA